MSEQLREALTDLTDRPVPPPPASDALWRRGRRRHRARQVAAAFAALAAVVAGGAWWTSLGPPSAELGPIDAPTERLRIPDTLREPNGWTRSVAHSGPPGPLSVVAKAETRSFWLVSEERWFGVSGRDQTYRWLDLPGMAEDEYAWVELSPDGRYLGYHLGGEPTAAVAQSDIVGVAVYDTVTGTVTERRVPTKHGLSVDFDGLTWSADSAYLVTTYGQYGKQMGTSTFPVTESWRPTTGAVLQLSAFGDERGSATESSLHAWGERLWTWIDGRMVGVDPSDGSVRELEGPRSRSRGMVPGPPVLNQGGTRLVYLGSARRQGGNFTTLASAAVAADGSVGRHSMLKSPWRPQQVQGWVDGRTALVRALRFPAAATSERHAVLAWDVEDGSTRQAIGLDASVHDLQLAAVATQHPFVDARSWRVPAPPPLVAIVVLGSLVGVVLVWRNRRRSSAERDADLPGGGQ